MGEAPEPSAADTAVTTTVSRGGGVALTFGDFSSSAVPSASASGRPWRKPRAAVRQELVAEKAVLGDSGGGGVDFAALSLVLEAREALCGNAEPPADLDAAATAALQAATNARPAAEVEAAVAELRAALDKAGVALPTRKADVTGRKASTTSATARLSLFHEVAPRLLLGGWAALNNGCEALRRRGVTHVVSVVSADQRALPFVHHYVRSDDREDAAAGLAEHFPAICAFVDGALRAGGTVYVHCGAGISRGPTAVLAYLVWRHGLRVRDALALVRRERACVRPNAGFLRELRRWEARCAVAGEQPAAEPGGRLAVERPGSGAP